MVEAVRRLRIGLVAKHNYPTKHPNLEGKKDFR